MKFKKILRCAFVLAYFCACIFVEQSSVAAQNNVPVEISAQVVKKNTGEAVSELTATDFRLYEDGREQKILSVARETRPLSIVVAFVTAPSRCSDGLGRDTFELATAFEKALTSDEDLAIVMTNESGQVVRNFNSEKSSLRDDFAKAENIAGKNTYSYEERVTQPDSTFNVVFGMYPLPALQTAVKLLRENAPRSHERVILLVNTLQNTSVGKSAAGRALLSELIEERVIVSRIGNGNADKSFDLSNVPFGKRNFYLGLANFTGGESQGCPGQNPVLDLFRSRPKPSGTSLQDDLTAFLDHLRTRYRINYRSDNTNSKQPRSIKLELANLDRKDKDLAVSYWKAVRTASR